MIIKNIEAKEKFNILEFAKAEKAPCIILWDNFTFIATITMKDVTKVEIMKDSEDGTIIVYINNSYIYCKSIHFMNLVDDIQYIYAKNKNEFHGD